MKATILAVAWVLAGGEFVFGQAGSATRPAEKRPEPKVLALGAAAPAFDLPGADGKRYSLKSFSDAKVLVVVFTCNHCPTAQAYEGRIRKLAADYRPKGVALVAISPNDPKALRLDELGYTDVGDTLEDMKIRAKQAGFDFPYLYDGDTQESSRQYGPAATPTVYVFDRERKLRYVGRVDDSEREKDVKSHDARNAIDALLAGRPVGVEKTKTFGCSTKWADKRWTVDEAMKKLAAEPVALEEVDLKGLQQVMAGSPGKLRLVNFWATWCGECITEFPELVTIHRMYRHRDFELVTVSADYPDKRGEALGFLKKQQASNRNVHFKGNRYEMIEAVDKEWDGNLPLTVLIGRDGRVLLKKAGRMDPLAVRGAIVKELGRTY